MTIVASHWMNSIRLRRRDLGLGALAFGAAAVLPGSSVLGVLTLGAMLSLQCASGPGGSLSSFVRPAQAAEETPKDMLAVQIRTQGFACDKPLGASRDAKRSKPDHPVWILKCGNARYRISRAPDMAAKVEPLK